MLRIWILLAALYTMPVLAESAPGNSPYVLYAPLNSEKTYLLDGENKVAKEWTSEYRPGMVAYLLEDGSLLRSGMVADETNIFYQGFQQKGPNVPTFNVGGIIERIEPDNSVSWKYTRYSDTFMPHHDIQLMPNGNILLIGWERKTRDEAIAAGRDPKTVTEKWGLWVDSILEIKPTGPESGDVVWQWHAWDHLLQNFDSSKANYGDPKENPGKLDINYWKFRTGPADMMHTNAVDYNAELDQILISSYAYSEIYVIDHSTTTEEAASDTGGKQGKGGQFLYRWGNPEAYGHDRTGITTTAAQHDANWGNSNGSIWLYDNNRDGRSTYAFNITTPVQPDGSYPVLANGTYGPVFPDFQSELGFDDTALGTARKLPSGNVFSCDCINGYAIFIEEDGTISKELKLTENISDAALSSAPSAFRILAYEHDYPGILKLLNQ